MPGNGSFAMLLGGYDRVGVTSIGPSNDVRVLVEELGAVVFDFGWLEAPDSPFPRRFLALIARRTGLWSAALAVATSLEVRRFSAVYVSGEDVGVIACAVSRLLPRKRRPAFVMRVERPVYGRTRVRRFLHRRVMGFASRHVDVALCRTTLIARYMRESTRARNVIAFGQEIDTAFFDPERVSPVPTNLPVQTPFILSAGLEQRDYKTLLEAADLCPAALVIAAGSPWSKDAFDVDGELPDNVVVGQFSSVEMRQLYQLASVVVLSVHPTERACGMNVIGEAWAMAKPVIASSTLGIQDFVTAETNGLLVPPRDAPALRAAIERLLEDHLLARQLGAGGQQYVRERLSLDRFRNVVVHSVAGAT